jgi:hypothetical protein
MEHVQEYINNYYGPIQSEFQLTLLFLKDINVPQKYKQKYLAQYQKAVPMDIDITSNANTYTNTPNTRSSSLGLSRNLESIKENYKYKY